MSGVRESDVEDAAFEWLEGCGWETASGPAIAAEAPDAERADFGVVILAHIGHRAMVSRSASCNRREFWRWIGRNGVDHRDFWSLPR